MNKCFKVVYSKARVSHVAVSEVASSIQAKSSKTIVSAAVALMLSSAGGAFAIPLDHHVENGGQTVETNAVLTSVKLTGSHAQSAEEGADSAIAQKWMAVYVGGGTVAGNNLNLSYTLNRDTSDPAKTDAVYGRTLAVNGQADVTLSGDTTDISLAVKDAVVQTSSSDAFSAVGVYGGGTLSFEATETNITADNGNSRAPLTGLMIQHDGSEVSMTGQTVNINVSSATEAALALDEDDFSAYSVSGVVLKGGATTFNTSDATTLNVTVKNTATGGDGAEATGFDAENSKVTLGGITNITVETRSHAVSETIGIKLNNEADDAGEQSFTNNGKLTVAATGSESYSMGVLLGSESDAKVTFTSNGTLDINATSNGSDEVKSMGIYFDPEEHDGKRPNIEVNLAGTTTITAEEALYSEPNYGYEETDHIGKPIDSIQVNVSGDLTLNGNVGGFKGIFNQTAGKTVLNASDYGFFDTQVNLSGGEIDASDDAWGGDSSDMRISVSGGELKIGAMQISSGDALSFTGGTITVTGQSQVDDREWNEEMEGNALVITEFGMLEGTEDVPVEVVASGDSHLIVQGSASIKGNLIGLGALTVENEKSNNFYLNGMLSVTKDVSVTGGTLTTGKNSLLKVGGDMTVTDATWVNEGDNHEVTGDLTLVGTNFTNKAGRLEVKNGTLTIGEGTTITDYGDVASDSWVLKTGGAYYMASEFFEDDGSIALSSGRLELAGGMVGNAVTKQAFTGEFHVVTDPEDAADPDHNQSQLAFSAGDYTLDGITVDLETNQRAGLVVSGGTLNLGKLLLKRGNVAFEGGTITITGEGVDAETNALEITQGVTVNASGDSALVIKHASNIDGDVKGLGSLSVDIGSEEDFRVGGSLQVSGDVTVSGGTLDLVEDAEMALGGKLTFKDGAYYSSAGTLNAAGGLVFEDGTTLIEWDLEEDGSLLIESGKVDFNGNVNIATGNEETPITKLSIGPNDESGVYENASVTFNGGTYSFESVQVQEGSLTLTGDKGNVTIDELSISEGDVALTGGNLTTGNIVFTETTEGKLTINGGTLNTSTDQIFTAAAGANVFNPEALKNPDRIDFTSGTLVFNDAEYNQLYADWAGNLVGADTDFIVKFTGHLNESIDGEIDIGDLADSDSTVHGTLDAAVSADEGTTTATINKSVGVSSVVAKAGVESVGISAGKTVTLVGGSDQAKEVISFAEGTDGKVDVAGTVALGTKGSTDEQGTLSSAVTVNESGKLAVNGGTFTVADTTVQNKGAIEVAGGQATFNKVSVDGGSVNVSGGKATFNELTATNSTINTSNGTTSIKNLTVSGETSIASGQTAAKVENLNLGNGENSITITGVVDVAGFAEKTGGSQTTVNIGTPNEDGKFGDLTISGQTLAGATYFLDPAFQDGIEQGSSLKFEGTTVDGKIIAGQNSYVVLGSTDDSALLKVFEQNEKLSWGGENGQIGAAVFVAKPITVDQTGGIYADASLTSATAVTGDSVYFAANSALVADVSELDDSKYAITVAEGASVTVKEGSKAVLVGDIKQGIGYQLINNAEANEIWGKNLIAGNAMWDLEMNEDGKIEATLQDASLIYGNAMQGSALANAGMQATGAEYDYVNGLLTDASGNINALPSVAERFDAAMNPAGALTAFTTAYDRASDFRRVVREESVKGQGNRLWAQVTGGKTKLDGISSGGRSINTETDVYGIAVGGEAEFSSFTLGAAFTGGTGHTDNDAVDGKDDFEYYGLSVYGKTSVAGFDILGDVSATWLRSDFTIGGAADVDTDTTTAVYSFGLQGEKTFEMSWADITPFIGLDVYHVRSDGFDNGHGAKIDDSDATAVEIPIGARISKNIETTGGFSMSPSFMLAVVPTIADTEIDSKVRFAGAQSTYKYTFADDVKIRSNIGLDAVKDNFTFGLRAGYEWGDEERSAVNLQLRAKYAF